MKRWLVLALLLFSAFAMADEPPKAKVRARLEPAGPVVPGQQVKLIVDVLVTTWFTGAPQFPALTIPGAVAQLSDQQLPHLNETLGEVHWTGISRFYSITAQAGGELAIPSFEITVQAGQAKAPLKVTTSAMKLVVKGTPGAPTATPSGAGPGRRTAQGPINNMPASTRLVITQQLDRHLDGLKVGDAFTRSVRIVANGSMAMFLPPTRMPTPAGLTPYPKLPSVENLTTDRGEFIAGQRVDAITYVVQTAGHYEFPPITVRWWDTTTNRERTASLPALRFDAVANPGYKPTFALPTEARPVAEQNRRFDRRRVVRGAAIALAIGLLLWLLRPRLASAWQAFLNHRAERRRQHAESEAAAYRDLVQATRSGDSAHLIALLYRWIDRLPALPHPRRLNAVADHPAIDQLLAAEYGVGSRRPASDALRSDLAAIRNRGTHRERRASRRFKSLAATLNP